MGQSAKFFAFSRDSLPQVLEQTRREGSVLQGKHRNRLYPGFPFWLPASPAFAPPRKSRDCTPSKLHVGVSNVTGRCTSPCLGFHSLSSAARIYAQTGISVLVPNSTVLYTHPVVSALLFSLGFGRGSCSHR